MIRLSLSCLQWLDWAYLVFQLSSHPYPCTCQIRKQSDKKFVSLNPKYEKKYTFFFIFGGPGKQIFQGSKTSSQSRHMYISVAVFFLCFPSPWPHKTGSVCRKNKKGILMYSQGNMCLHVDLFIKYVSNNVYSDNHGQPQSILNIFLTFLVAYTLWQPFVAYFCSDIDIIVLFFCWAGWKWVGRRNCLTNIYFLPRREPKGWQSGTWETHKIIRPLLTR